MTKMNTMLVRPCAIGLLLWLALRAGSTASAAAQPTFRVVYNLQTYNQPGGLLEGSPGIFYSTAASVSSVIFSVTSQGSPFTILGTIPNGALFQSLLVSAANSRFYSYVYFGNQPITYNTFSVTAAPGAQKVYPAQIFDPEFTQNLPDGRLLGVGPNGSSIWGVLASDLQGVVTSIAAFPSTDRTENVIYASDGNYYGVVEPAQGYIGYLFRLTPSGSLTKLYTFPPGTFTSYLPTPLLQASDGNLYGAVITGGANGTGMVYKLTLSGQFTLLHSFEKGLGVGGPASLIEASDANLYGVYQATSGEGHIFRMSKSGNFAVVYSMTGSGGTPPCWVVQGSDGQIYGIAHAGGSTGSGTLFALNAGLPKPKPQMPHFTPKSGPVGTKVLIWGYNLLSASVQFNGVAATAVSNSGSNYISATVPSGASTGPITITTPGGTVSTKSSFTIQ